MYCSFFLFFFLQLSPYYTTTQNKSLHDLHLCCSSPWQHHTCIKTPCAPTTLQTEGPNFVSITAITSSYKLQLYRENNPLVNARYIAINIQSLFWQNYYLLLEWGFFKGLEMSKANFKRWKEFLKEINLLFFTSFKNGLKVAYFQKDLPFWFQQPILNIIFLQSNNIYNSRIGHRLEKSRDFESAKYFVIIDCWKCFNQKGKFLSR